MFSLTKFSARKELEEMLKSSRPASSNCVWLTCGPPCWIVTSSPCLRINAGGDGLIVTAVFRLGLPVQSEGDLVVRAGDASR